MKGSALPVVEPSTITSTTATTASSPTTFSPKTQSKTPVASPRTGAGTNTDSRTTPTVVASAGKRPSHHRRKQQGKRHGQAKGQQNRSNTNKSTIDSPIPSSSLSSSASNSVPASFSVSASSSSLPSSSSASAAPSSSSSLSTTSSANSANNSSSKQNYNWRQQQHQQQQQKNRPPRYNKYIGGRSRSKRLNTASTDNNKNSGTKNNDTSVAKESLPKDKKKKKNSKNNKNSKKKGPPLKTAPASAPDSDSDPNTTNSVSPAAPAPVTAAESSGIAKSKRTKSKSPFRKMFSSSKGGKKKEGINSSKKSAPPAVDTAPAAAAVVEDGSENGSAPQTGKQKKAKSKSPKTQQQQLERPLRRERRLSGSERGDNESSYNSDEIESRQPVNSDTGSYRRKNIKPSSFSRFFGGDGRGSSSAAAASATSSVTGSGASDEGDGSGSGEQQSQDLQQDIVSPGGKKKGGFMTRRFSNAKDKQPLSPKNTKPPPSPKSKRSVLSPPESSRRRLPRFSSKKRVPASPRTPLITNTGIATPSKNGRSVSVDGIGTLPMALPLSSNSSHSNKNGPNGFQNNDNKNNNKNLVLDEIVKSTATTPISQLTQDQIQELLDKAPMTGAVPNTVLHTTNYRPYNGFVLRTNSDEKIDDDDDNDEIDDDDDEPVTTSQVLLFPEIFAPSTNVQMNNTNGMSMPKNFAAGNGAATSAAANAGAAMMNKNNNTPHANFQRQMDTSFNNFLENSMHYNRRPAWISVRFYKGTSDVRLGIRWRQNSTQSNTNVDMAISYVDPTGALAACPMQVSGGDESVIPIQVGDRLVRLDEHIISPNHLDDDDNNGNEDDKDKKKPRQWQVQEVGQYLRSKTGWVDMLLFNPFGDPDLSQACIYKDHLKDTESLGLSLTSSSTYYHDYYDDDETILYGKSNDEISTTTTTTITTNGQKVQTTTTTMNNSKNNNDVHEVLRIERIDTNGLLGNRSIAKPGDYVHAIHHMSVRSGMDLSATAAPTTSEAVVTAASLSNSYSEEDTTEDGDKKPAAIPKPPKATAGGTAKMTTTTSSAAAPDLITFTVTNGNNIIYVSSLREMFATLPSQSSSRRLLNNLSLSTTMPSKQNNESDGIDEETNSQGENDDDGIDAAASAAAAAATVENAVAGDAQYQQSQRGKRDVHESNSSDDDDDDDSNDGRYNDIHSPPSSTSHNGEEEDEDEENEFNNTEPELSRMASGASSFSNDSENFSSAGPGAMTPPPPNLGGGSGGDVLSRSRRMTEEEWTESLRYEVTATEVMDMSYRSDHGGGVGGPGAASERPEYHGPGMGTVTINGPSAHSVAASAAARRASLDMNNLATGSSTISDMMTITMNSSRGNAAPTPSNENLNQTNSSSTTMTTPPHVMDMTEETAAAVASTLFPQPRYVSVSLTKKSRDDKLGLTLANYKDGTLIVKRTNPGGLLSDSIFQAGCRLLSINNFPCQSWTYVEALNYLRGCSGRLTIIGEYPNGDMDCLQATVHKETPTSPVGLTFQQQQGVGLLRMSRINPKGAFSHSVVGVGDALLAINGLSGDGMTAKEAATYIKSSPTRVSVLTRTTGYHAIVFAKIRSEKIRSQNEGDEVREGQAQGQGGVAVGGGDAVSNNINGSNGNRPRASSTSSAGGGSGSSNRPSRNSTDSSRRSRRSRSRRHYEPPPANNWSSIGF